MWVSPKRAELTDVNISTGAQSIHTESQLKCPFGAPYFFPWFQLKDIPLQEFELRKKIRNQIRTLKVKQGKLYVQYMSCLINITTHDMLYDAHVYSILPYMYTVYYCQSSH